MTRPSLKLLLGALSQPESLLHLTMVQWELLLRQARNAEMMARIAADCKGHGLMERIAPQPMRHLASAAILLERQHHELHWEVDQIAQALTPTGVPLVLLKGAAYAQSRRLAARGRSMTDVDILVPKADLSKVESALMMRGWVSGTQTEYDQHYYRTWMHELPPMRHVHRGTVIDIHHAILPLSARVHPDSALLLAAAVPIHPGSAVKCLAPADMLIHSATHLFHEGEFEHGFRGLVDIDALVREFAEIPGFWRDLVPRAVALELVRPLFYALRYSQIMLGTPIPQAAMQALLAAQGAPKPGLFLTWMDALFLRALVPTHATTTVRGTPAARLLLYLRGHWLRMPPGLLLAHLTRKLLTRKAKVKEVNLDAP